jgi:hypothetical protein
VKLLLLLAALQVGIAENKPEMFHDPLFPDLGAKHVRVVVSYNVMTRRDDELQRVTEYLNAAKERGIEPLVTFEHQRGAAERCREKRFSRKPQCRLPTASSYRNHFRLFRKKFPWVRTYVAWNEINHFTQPTYRNPKAAARFSDIARRECRGCKVVVADILDQADNVNAKQPRFRSTVRYIERFKKALKSPRRYCGLHNYSDTNRFRDTGTRKIIKALGCQEIWLTETGGIYRFGRFGTSASRQLRATKYMFTLAERYPRIKRLYVYTFFGRVTPRFDAGLVARGHPRPAYDYLRRKLRLLRPPPAGAAGR